MLHPIPRLGALMTALALLLTACAPAPQSSASGAPSQDLDAVAVLQPDPRPSQPDAPPAPPTSPAQEAEAPAEVPVLTQEDIDDALAQVMANYRATAVSVATIEHGALSQSGA